MAALPPVRVTVPPGFASFGEKKLGVLGDFELEAFQRRPGALGPAGRAFLAGDGKLTVSGSVTATFFMPWVHALYRQAELLQKLELLASMAGSATLSFARFEAALRKLRYELRLMRWRDARRRHPRSRSRRRCGRLLPKAHR